MNGCRRLLALKIGTVIGETRLRLRQTPRMLQLRFECPSGHVDSVE